MHPRREIGCLSILLVYQRRQVSGTAGQVVVEPHLSTQFAPSVVGVVLHLNTVGNHHFSYTQLSPLAHDAEPSSLQSAPTPPSLVHVIGLDLQYKPLLQMPGVLPTQLSPALRDGTQLSVVLSKQPLPAGHSLSIPWLSLAQYPVVTFVGFRHTFLGPLLGPSL
jgi:hypothetical protein